MMYIPQAQVPDAVNALNVSISPMAWVVRTRGAPEAMTATIEEQLRQTTGLPTFGGVTMDDVVVNSASRQRFNMWLMIAFGLSALLLAAIGIYGLMAYSVKQRSHEIGIRLALGASPGSIRNMIVLQDMVLAVVGIAVGIGAALGLTRFIDSLLFGVESRDILVFVAAPILLWATALVAVWIPATRAGRFDPLEALRDN